MDIPTTRRGFPKRERFRDRDTEDGPAPPMLTPTIIGSGSVTFDDEHTKTVVFTRPVGFSTYSVVLTNTHPVIVKTEALSSNGFKIVVSSHITGTIYWLALRG
jgi:hypothetical protein